MIVSPLDQRSADIKFFDGDGLQIGTGPISLYSGIVLLAVIAAVAVLYYRKKTVPADEITVPVS